MEEKGKKGSEKWIIAIVVIVGLLVAAGVVFLVKP